MTEKILTEAKKIAARDLRSCYSDLGILTGSRSVYWSWDSFFASFGALALGDQQIVKKNLSLYLTNQSSEGNIPKRIANPLYPLKYLGLPIKESPQFQKPSFASPYYTGISISQNPVFIIAFERYVSATNDIEFLKENYNKLEKIMSFLEKHTYSSGLLKESLGGGWAESVLKRGAVTYTNICYVESLRAMSELSTKLQSIHRQEHYKRQSRQLIKAVDSLLWDESRGGFYCDWLGWHKHHSFSSDGNLLAVLWNVADTTKSKKILTRITNMLESSILPLPLTFDSYSYYRVFIANRIGGLKDYHVGFSWLWLGALAAICFHQNGQKDAAKKVLKQIAQRIVNDGAVYEIYHHNKPVNLLLYKSEKPWAWSAGLFLYACKTCDL